MVVHFSHGAYRDAALIEHLTIIRA